MDRAAAAAAFDGRDARSTPARLADGPDRPDRPDAARVDASVPANPQLPATTPSVPTQPFDTQSSASSSFPSNGSYPYAQQPLPPAPYSSNTTSGGSDSQDTASSAPTTASSADAERVHTPPGTAGGPDAGGSKNSGYQQQHATQAHAHEHEFSSQESQLLQLSTLAAARERMADTSGPDLLETDAHLSRKRTADGTVKHTRNASSASPMYVGGHSRNTSTVSVASTAGSRIGELSAELKARLSYAMVKVNNGWHSHSIDQVENLASQAGSPTSSSTSTIHGRQAASVSPRIPGMPSSHNRQLSQASQAGESTTASRSSASALEPSPWSSSQQAAANSHSTPPLPSPLAPPRAAGAAAPPRSLAPPASIQAARPRTLARRRSNPNDTTPAAFAAAHAHHASPHTPSNPVASSGAAAQQTPMGEPMLFSPDQNVREQDAIETLLFMSSPGNSENMKHFPSFASASQPLPSGHHDAHQRTTPLATASPQRHALPTVPRRALPQPPFYSSSVPSPAARTPGHRRNPSDMMDMDEVYGGGGGGAPRSAKGTPRRRAHGGALHHGAEGGLVSPRLKVPLSMPTGLSVPSKPRPLLAEEDIDRLLDRAAAADDDSSDSDSEILIPARPAGPVGM